jgi:hypothetical protein
MMLILISTEMHSTSVISLHTHRRVYLCWKVTFCEMTHRTLCSTPSW